jgi:hypothetical protein
VLLSAEEQQIPSRQWWNGNSLEKVLDKSPNLCYNKYVPKGTKNQIMKEVVTMANKKTVVQMYEEILAIPTLTAEQKAFIEKRIEITQKKNANRGNGEPTPKQKEKMAVDTAIEDAVLSVMAEGVSYTASDLVKLIDRTDVPNTQKLTPRLTALVEANKVVKSTVKGRTHYSLPSADEGEGEDE